MKIKRRNLLLPIGLSLLAIVSFSLQIFYSRISHFGPFLLPLSILALTILTTIFAIASLKTTATKKFIYLIVFVLVEIIIIPQIGFEIEKPFSRLYYSLNEKSFEELFKRVSADSILYISTDYNKSYKITKKNGAELEDQDLLKIAMKLNFRLLKAQNDPVIFYDYSSFYGFGYIVDYHQSETLLLTKKKTRKTKITENIYFFRY